MSTTNNSVNPTRPVGKPVLRPIGEVVGLFPEADPERFLLTFDLYALAQVQVQKAVLGHDINNLPWPPLSPLRLREWLQGNDVRIMTVKKLGEQRTYRRFIKYRLILGQEETR